MAGVMFNFPGKAKGAHDKLGEDEPLESLGSWSVPAHARAARHSPVLRSPL